MARGSRGTVNTAGKPRGTKLVAHEGTPGSKATPKPQVLVTGRRASTGTK